MRIYVAGATTLIGSALVRRLLGGVRLQPDQTMVTDSEPDLTDRAAVQAFFDRTRPDVVFMAAGKSAGIAGNQVSGT